MNFQQRTEVLNGRQDLIPLHEELLLWEVLGCNSARCWQRSLVRAEVYVLRCVCIGELIRLALAEPPVCDATNAYSNALGMPFAVTPKEPQPKQHFTHGLQLKLQI